MTDEQKTALIGEAYKAQKMTQGTNNQYVQAKSEKDHDGPFQKKYENTAQKIADDFKVGEQTVKRAEHFVDGLDRAERPLRGDFDRTQRNPPRFDSERVFSVLITFSGLVRRGS